jgi:hypothetical protein
MLSPLGPKGSEIFVTLEQKFLWCVCVREREREREREISVSIKC